MKNLKTISTEKMYFAFNINGTCYCSTDNDIKDRVLYMDHMDKLFYKKNGKKIYLNDEQTKKFNKTQGY